jgi:hypothetical protein
LSRLNERLRADGYATKPFENAVPAERVVLNSPGDLYVATALDAIAAGQPVAVASTRAHGWSVKYKEGWA